MWEKIGVNRTGWHSAQIHTTIYTHIAVGRYSGISWQPLGGPKECEMNRRERFMSGEWGLVDWNHTGCNYSFNSHSLVDVLFPNEILYFIKDHQKSLMRERGERERERERERVSMCMVWKCKCVCVCVCVHVLACESHCVHDTDPVKHFNHSGWAGV